MKKGKIKKIIFCAVLLFAVFYSNNIKVNADGVCKIYKDYYYFLDSSAKSIYDAKFEETDIYTRTPTNTFVPAGEATNSKMLAQYQIEMLRSANLITDGKKQMDLAKYYANLKKIKAGEEKTLTTPNGPSTINIYKEKETDDDVVRHILHGKWYKNGEERSNNTASELVKLEDSKLINSSIIPTGELTQFPNVKGTGIEFKKEGNIFNVVVERSILKTDLDNLTPISISSDGDNYKEVYNAPGVYYVEYEYCTYKGTVNYYYTGTEEKVVFEDKSANPYIKEGLEAGDTHDVTSPELKNCKPDKDKVTLEIPKSNPHDVTENVYYTCDTYKGTVNYYYTGTKEKVEFEDKSANPNIREELKPGDKYNVTSPELKNCTPDKDEVEIKIDETNPTNVTKDVYYTCKTYNAEIHYVKEGTKEPIKDEDKLKDSYTKSGLEDGYTEKVTSPNKIEGCTIKDENDIEVEVKIEGDHFHKIVEYVCEVPKNEKTGSFLIYIAWITGLGALAYATYYFINLKKEIK